MRIIKQVFKLIFVLLIVSGLLFAGYILTAIRNLPDPAIFNQRRLSQSTKIYDRTGKILLYEIHGEEKRTIIPFKDIPQYVKQATLAIEDSQFYNHGAFDWRSIIRAFFINLIKGKITQGGSTITQQLAKNAFLTPERTIKRKIKELILAIQLEKKYSKDEILELYLNQIPYGSNAYGIEAAAQTFFKKSAKDLTLAESALLASLPKAPTYYSPYGNHVDELKKRQEYVLNQMHQLGFIDQEELERAKEEKLKFAPQATGIKAPHFVIAIQDYLIKKYGEELVRNGGLRVISTLDWDLQQIAEKVIAEGVERNTKLYNGKNGALVAEDPKTGQILALVGSKDYFDTENDGNFNVAIQGLRQPGSAIKPFAYLTAFQKGFIPQTIVFDVPTNFDTTGLKPYTPHNFDNRFRGPVSLREALAQSINVPSVKVLYLAGINNLLNNLEKFGITTLTEHSRYGLSLALGGGEVKLIEMVGAYSVLAQEGIRREQSMILKVTDSEGNVLEEYKNKAEQVIDPQYARLVNDILSDIEARKGLYQNSLYLTIIPNQEVALKTGTTNDYKDAWTFGYTPSLVVGVWVGNNNNQPMQKQGSSILAALPIWHAFFSQAVKNKPLETFTRPDPVESDIPMVNGEYIINEEIHNILHYIDPDSSQYQNWEESLVKWLEENPEIIQNNNKQELITIEIKKPKNGTFINNNKIVIDADINSNYSISKISVFLNGQLIEEKTGNLEKKYNYKNTLTVTNLNLQNELKIKVENSASQQTEKKIIIYTK